VKEIPEIARRYTIKTITNNIKEQIIIQNHKNQIAKLKNMVLKEN